MPAANPNVLLPNIPPRPDVLAAAEEAPKGSGAVTPTPPAVPKILAVAEDAAEGNPKGAAELEANRGAPPMPAVSGAVWPRTGAARLKGGGWEAPKPKGGMGGPEAACPCAPKAGGAPKLNVAMR